MKTIVILQLIAALNSSNAIPALGDFFDDADVNGDGNLTIEEMAAIEPGITREIFQAVDKNGNGTIDYDEFEEGVEEGYLHER